jgi:hypothetical protein
LRLIVELHCEHGAGRGPCSYHEMMERHIGCRSTCRPRVRSSKIKIGLYESTKMQAVFSTALCAHFTADSGRLALRGRTKSSPAAQDAEPSDCPGCRRRSAGYDTRRLAEGACPIKARRIRPAVVMDVIICRRSAVGSPSSSEALRKIKSHILAILKLIDQSCCWA